MTEEDKLLELWEKRRLEFVKEKPRLMTEAEKRAMEIRKERLRERINDALEPCPFCGGKAEIRNKDKSGGRERYQVVCVECTVCGAKTIERISDGYYDMQCSDEEIAAL